MSDEITYRIDAFLQDNSLTRDNTEDVYAVPASKEPADEERHPQLSSCHTRN